MPIIDVRYIQAVHPTHQNHVFTNVCLIIWYDSFQFLLGCSLLNLLVELLVLLSSIAQCIRLCRTIRYERRVRGPERLKISEVQDFFHRSFPLCVHCYVPNDLHDALYFSQLSRFRDVSVSDRPTLVCVSAFRPPAASIHQNRIHGPDRVWPKLQSSCTVHVRFGCFFTG